MFRMLILLLLVLGTVGSTPSELSKNAPDLHFTVGPEINPKDLKGREKTSYALFVGATLDIKETREHCLYAYSSNLSRGELIIGKEFRITFIEEEYLQLVDVIITSVTHIDVPQFPDVKVTKIKFRKGKFSGEATIEETKDMGNWVSLVICSNKTFNMHLAISEKVIGTYIDKLPSVNQGDK